MVIGMPQSWEADAHGDGKTSLAVLLGWLTSPGNYARWQRAGKKKKSILRDDEPQGIKDILGAPLSGHRVGTRARLLQEIVGLLHAEGLMHREERDVRSKIRDLEKSFWDAAVWKTEVEAELREEERQKAARNVRSGTAPEKKEAEEEEEPFDLHAELTKHCKHFHTLAPALLAVAVTPPPPLPLPPPPSLASLASVADRTDLNDADVLALTSVCDRKLWGGDAMVAVDGTPKTSMEVLLDWLSIPSNYARWHTPNNKTIGHKEVLLREIVDDMQRFGLTHRTTRDVRTKINELERTVRGAIAWRDRYGEAILRQRSDGDGDGNKNGDNTVLALDAIRTGMTSVCKHFDRIGPAMVPLLCGEATAVEEEDQEEDQEDENGDVDRSDKDEKASNGSATYDPDTSDNETINSDDRFEAVLLSLKNGLRANPKRQAYAQRERSVKDDTAPSQSVGTGYGYSGRSFVPILPRSASSTPMAMTSRLHARRHTQARAQAQTQAQPQPQAQSHAKPHNKPHAEPKPKPQPQPFTEPKAHSPASPHTEPQVQAQPQAQPQPQPQAQPHSPVTAEKRVADRDEAPSPDEPALKKPATQDGVALTAPSRISANADIHEVQRQVELDKLHHERRCHVLHEERLTLEVARQQIHITKEKALARHELRQAGVPEAEINLAFPLV